MSRDANVRNNDNDVCVIVERPRQNDTITSKRERYLDIY